MIIFFKQPRKIELIVKAAKFPVSIEEGVAVVKIIEDVKKNTEFRIQN